MRCSKDIQSDHFTCECFPPPFHVILSDLTILSLVHFPFSFQQVSDLVMILSTVVFKSVVFSIQLLPLLFKQTLWNLTRKKLLRSRTPLPLLFWEERGVLICTYVWRCTYRSHIASKCRVCEAFILIRFLSFMSQVWIPETFVLQRRQDAQFDQAIPLLNISQKTRHCLQMKLEFDQTVLLPALQPEGARPAC